MKKELDLSYDVIVENMIPFTEGLSQQGMNLSETTFFNKKGKEVTMTVLRNEEEPGSIGCKQIFQMKDGKFILEIEDEEGVEYFYSEKIEDLF